MNEAEYADILQFTQRRMQEYGLASLNDRIVSDLRVHLDNPSTRLLRYLDALESELRLRTASTVRTITERFRATVDTESGQPIDGLSVLLSEEDRDLFGTEVVDLKGDSNLDALVSEIAELRAELSETRDRGH